MPPKTSALPPGGPEGDSSVCLDGCACIACAVRALLSLVDVQDVFPGEEREILLDIHVDGSRYLLVRVPGQVDAGVPLSPREQGIVRMVSGGSPNKVIADVLNISPWTVCTHLRRIFAKLGVTSRAAMVARALEGGPSSKIPRVRPVVLSGS